MMLVRVMNDTLRAQLLIHLIEQLERGDLAVLLEKGTCPRLIDRLRGMSISDLLQLASSGHPDIHFSINEDGFELGIASLDRRREESEHLIYFMQNGATASMLNESFPQMDPRVIQSYRKLIKLDRRNGRVALPDEAVRDLIHKCWHGMPEEYPDMKSLRERLILLHGFFGDYPLDVLYATVNEFKAAEAKEKRKSHGKK